jgi:hypothetical protein
MDILTLTFELATRHLVLQGRSSYKVQNENEFNNVCLAN